jgi:hypothetical protein
MLAEVTGPVTPPKLAPPSPTTAIPIPLRSHEDIQLDVGTPAVAAQRVDWSQSQL